MASPLEQLPAELFARIALEVSSTKISLSPLAATSRQCQTHVEAITFKNIRLDHSRILDCRRIVTKERFLALRSTSLDVTSDSYKQQLKEHRAWETGLRFGGPPTSTRISVEDLDSLNETFTALVADFLVFLKEGSGESPQRHAGLNFSLIGPFLPPNCKYVQQPEDEPEIRFERAWIRLLEEKLPEELFVSAVTSFGFLALNGWQRSSSQLWPASWSPLMARFPYLQHAHFYIDDHEDRRNSVEEIRNDRNAFASSLRHLPCSLKNVNLSYRSWPPENQRFAPLNLKDPNLGYDVFSRQLGVYAHRLVVLELHSVTLDLPLFFRACAETSMCSLERLCLWELRAASANGSWYYDLDPRIAPEELDEINIDEETLESMRERFSEDELPPPMDKPLLPFRSAMDPKAFKDIYMAAAEAVKRMPRLQDFNMGYCHLLDGRENQFEGYHDFEYKRDEEHGNIRVQWSLGAVLFDCDEGVVRAWKEVGAIHGVEIELLWDAQEESYWPERSQPRRLE